MAVHPTQVQALAAEWAVSALDGLVATHFLYRLIQWRHWSRGPGWKLLVRFSYVLPLMAAILNAIDWTFVHFARIPCGIRTLISLPLLLVTWGNWIFVLISWSALYFALHEFRLRRAQELRELRMEVATHQMQLRRLRAQLNSHFLFNSLNGLRELIEQDPRRAQTIVEQLAAILRYSLQPDQPELVPLADEVRAVKDYLALESMRFEERLSSHWDISPEAYSVQVPAMLLQTLVENALKHGIAKRPQGGTVAIAARRTGLQMQLEVTNSGRIVGHQLNAGLGLKNVRERLNLLYGQGAALELESAGDNQVRASVTIPLVSTSDVRQKSDGEPFVDRRKPAL